MTCSPEKDDDAFSENGARESLDAYVESGICFGFEGWQGCCERELGAGETLCVRCKEVEQSYLNEAEEIFQRERRQRAGLFNDEEKDSIRENLDSNELVSFDQKCSIAEFVHGIKVALRSGADFLLAELKEDPALLDHAANVIAWHENRFTTVRELMDECESHQAGVRICEDWTLETARRVSVLMRSLHKTPGRALTVYAKHCGFLETSDELAALN